MGQGITAEAAIVVSHWEGESGEGEGERELRERERDFLCLGKRGMGNRGGIGVMDLCAVQLATHSLTCAHTVPPVIHSKKTHAVGAVGERYEGTNSSIVSHFH